VRAREVEQKLVAMGCELVRQKGAHRFWRSASGKCLVTVPAHAGEEIKPGTLRAIERSMEPCLGEKWLERG
jgi:predicted RNA binding protein YcfA (HicA-like mRNA interferase family)